MNCMHGYCTHIKISNNVRLDLFTPTCFRLRLSKLAKNKFPDKYEIPFAVGKTSAWNAVEYEKTIGGCVVTVKTSELLIELRASDGYVGAGIIVYGVDGKRLYPVDMPRYGMFCNKCIVFDSASFFTEY